MTYGLPVTTQPKCPRCGAEIQVYPHFCQEEIKHQLGKEGETMKITPQPDGKVLKVLPGPIWVLSRFGGVTYFTERTEALKDAQRSIEGEIRGYKHNCNGLRLATEQLEEVLEELKAQGR